MTFTSTSARQTAATSVSRPCRFTLATSHISFGANNNGNVYQGFSVVPVYYSDPSSIIESASGNQIIASVATGSVPDLAGTMPLLGLGLGALAAFGRRFRKQSPEFNRVTS